MTSASLDLLARFLERASRSADPIPLVATRIDIKIRGGLAVVTTERTFRNGEAESIEAAMTFPQPFDAMLCSLVARIGQRKLHAIAQPRQTARDTYEDALARGKTAVLHEEPLRGIHMVSVGPIAPNMEIGLTDTWTMPMAFVDGFPHLRIPTTVGDIYGQTPGALLDGIAADGPVQRATVTVRCENGAASLLRAETISGGDYDIPLNRPIDVLVSNWRPAKLRGMAADGRAVTLDIAPAANSSNRAVDVDILFDCSGSMGETVASTSEFKETKFAAARAGLIAAVRHLNVADRLRVWRFNDRVQLVGDGSGAEAVSLARMIDRFSGGTEIGHAIRTVAASGSRDIVMLTDGKSWALDVQKLAQTGTRLHAILIGDDALEANVAHLAGLTGGQVFLAGGSDTAGAIAAAINATRLPVKPPDRIAGAPKRVQTLRRGARIVATWDKEPEVKPTVSARQVGATAAALALPWMGAEAAAKLAVAEGLVTHLTSLVLVDEQGATATGLPNRRAVPLSHLEVQSAPPPSRSAAMFRRMPSEWGFGLACAASLPEANSASQSAPAVAPPSRTRPPADLSRMAERIDWSRDPEALRQGRFGQLALDVLAAICAAAEEPRLVAFADAIKIHPRVAVIALLASTMRSNPSARSFADSVLANAGKAAIADALRALSCGDGT